MLGRDVCGHWDAAIAHEWLVTNGLGGYACGTVAGANTRRYHGFLMASLEPPAGRTLLVAKVDVAAEYLGHAYPLSANEFVGTIDPRGFVNLESFTVVDGVPVWRYAIADAILEQKIFMARGANTSYLRLEVLRASAPLKLQLKPLVTYRDYHSQSRGRRPFRTVPDAAAAQGGAGKAGCTIDPGEGAGRYRLSMSRGTYIPADLWYWNFLHREEFARGLDAHEDLWGPGLFTTELEVGESVFFSASIAAHEAADEAPHESAPAVAPAAPAPAAEEILAAAVGRSRRLIAALPPSAPPWVQTLAAAADQFLVERGPGRAATAGVMAGYPWFGDWGRDTMISLPGLTTALGRHETAAATLRTYARYVDGGMLPNRFPDAGGGVEYNTADATLWMFQAIKEHLEATPDPAFLADLFPTLLGIIHAHVDGTRYGIKVDAVDGLLHAGEPGSQLTWMDAKHGDRAFTPRIGKPVEINALWLNALEVATRFAGSLQNAAAERFCAAALARVRSSFSRFWNADRRCLYDVLDADGGNTPDDSIRPNQLFAVSLPHSVLPQEQMRAVVGACGRELLTSYGLRSLSPGDPKYIGHYSGNAWERDSAYHQGTVWAWLLGPFARAHYRAYGNARLAMSFLTPVAQHLEDACVGSVSEVFDGDAPHTPRGCFAQAWSVAEILSSWIFLERAAGQQ